MKGAIEFDRPWVLKCTYPVRMFIILFQDHANLRNEIVYLRWSVRAINEMKRVRRLLMTMKAMSLF